MKKKVLRHLKNDKKEYLKMIKDDEKLKKSIGKGLLGDIYEGAKSGLSYIVDKAIDTGFYIGNKLLDPTSNIEFGERHIP